MQFLQNYKITTITKIGLIFFCAVFFLTNTYSCFAQKKYTVVLDAGHGGKDPGNIGNGYREKDIVLNVTLLTGKKLQNHKDINVVYTRKNDSYPPLWKRGEIANKTKADLFVSIHCDAYRPKPQAYGFGTFVLGLRGNQKNLEIAKRENAGILLEADYEKRYKGFNANSIESAIGLSLLQEENLDKSLSFASMMQQISVQKLKRKDRKVKQDNFQVLRETIMPSVLIELGFLTNKREGAYLNSKKGQEQMATAIAEAIKTYFENLKLNTVSLKPIVEEFIEKPIYKVQIAAGSRKLAAKSYNFKGLKNIERVKYGSLYKYYFGNTENFDSAKKILKLAKKKGYASAFIVAFKNGKLLSVKEALKLD